MDAVTLILTVAFVAVLWKLLFRKSRQAYLLEKLPGPKPYPIVGNLLEVLSLPRESKNRKNISIYTLQKNRFLLNLSYPFRTFRQLY